MLTTPIFLQAITHRSTVNGPGSRSVVHFQGCTIGCKGCFNVHTWKHKSTEATTVKLVINEVLEADSDITISGGEPLEQMPALMKLLHGFRRRAPEKTVVLFTGFTTEVLRKYGILGFLQLAGVDLVIAGPFVLEKRVTESLRGSSNQELLFLSDRIKPEDIQKRSIEVMITPDGQLTMSGFPSKKLTTAIRREGI